MTSLIRHPRNIQGIGFAHGLHKITTTRIFLT